MLGTLAHASQEGEELRVVRKIDRFDRQLLNTRVEVVRGREEASLKGKDLEDNPHGEGILLHF